MTPNPIKTYSDIDETQLSKITALPSTLIVDVREDWEYEEFNIGGLNIPLANIRENRHLLLPYQNIVIVCTNGTRSKVAAMDFCRAELLQDKNIYHLKGGILGVE